MRSKLFEPHPWKMWTYAWNNRGKGLVLPSFIGGFFLLAIGIPYGITNRISAFIGWTAFDPELPLDASISYIPILNIAYFSFYIYYILIPLFAQTEVQKKCAIIFSQRLFVGTLPVFLVFLILPVEVDLRSEVSGDDFLTTLLSLIHGVDQPYNAWPSLHVGHSLCVVLSLPFIYNINKFAHAALWLGWLLLTISTMTTQQHYLFDVITGILFALVAHYTFIQPVVAKCIEGEYDDAFQQL